MTDETAKFATLARLAFGYLGQRIVFMSHRLDGWQWSGNNCPFAERQLKGEVVEAGGYISNAARTCDAGYSLIIGIGQSIRQSVQNGQFPTSLSQDASHLLVTSHTDKRIERLLVHVIVTPLPLD
jgi:hypothetical protein